MHVQVDDLVSESANCEYQSVPISFGYQQSANLDHLSIESSAHRCGRIQTVGMSHFNNLIVLPRKQ